MIKHGLAALIANEKVTLKTAIKKGDKEQHRQRDRRAQQSLDGQRRMPAGKFRQGRGESQRQ